MTGRDVAALNLKYLISDLDRFGNRRWYVRVPGRRKIRVAGEPGSEAFTDNYWQAIKAEPADSRPRPRKAKQGTFGYLVAHYYASPEFAELNADHTQVERKRQLEPLREEYGDRPAMIPTAKIRAAIRKRKPPAARKFLSALRHVYAVAIASDLVATDPTFGLRVAKRKTRGFHSWTLEECLAYEARYPVGTMARTAYAIGIYLACRRSDAVRIGRPHESGGIIDYTQHKNRERDPVRMIQPIVPPLRLALDACQGKGLTYLETRYGDPFSEKGFGGRFKEWCVDAGLPHCTFHGLRKATSARLAEQGYTSRQIMAVLGDKTLQQAEVYTRAADNAKMARDALVGMFGEQIVPLSAGRSGSGTISVVSGNKNKA